LTIVCSCKNCEANAPFALVDCALSQRDRFGRKAKSPGAFQGSPRVENAT
jgi:hypothetical protein